MAYFLQILFGFLGGIFGGMGMGGGTLLIPLLVIFLNLDQGLCQGINLLTFLVMSLISMIIHYKNGLIVFDGVLQLILGGVCFSVLGAFLASFLPTKILRIFFGVFLLLLGVWQFLKVIKVKKNSLQKWFCVI